jgi:hypothetical protein
MRNGVSTLFGVVLILPLAAFAQAVQNITFTNDARTVAPSAVSEQLTVQTQSGGSGTVLPQTACLHVQSSSATGEFSSSATNWSAVSVITMSKNTTNKNFYYKDANPGSYVIMAELALKPETESRSCSSWPLDEWGTRISATQGITVGSSQQQSQDDGAAQETDEPEEQTQENGAPSQKAVPYYIPPPVPEFFADAGEDRTVIVGADTEFDGRVYNRDQVVLDKARYVWNFGDGSTAEGPAVLHHFDYPGRYAVILTAAAEKESLEDEIVVIAEPAQLSFMVNADGSVTIENRAGRDLDLSGWLVRSFGQVFTLPEHSIILAGESMRIAQKTLQFIAGLQTELAYPNGVTVLGANESNAPQAPAAAVTPSMPVTAVVSQRKAPANPVVLQTAEAADATGTEAIDTRPSQAAAAAAPKASYWWLALGVLIAFGAGAFAYIRRIKSGEWDIEEG